jgi:hypothetical protein
MERTDTSLSMFLDGIEGPGKVPVSPTPGVGLPNRHAKTRRIWANNRKSQDAATGSQLSGRGIVKDRQPVSAPVALRLWSTRLDLTSANKNEAANILGAFRRPRLPRLDA